MIDYVSFLAAKARVAQRSGIDVPKELLHSRLFDFQRDIVSRMLALGRGAIFASTGLGKTDMQVEWARIVERDSPALFGGVA